MTTGPRRAGEIVDQIVHAVEEVRALPYVWPSEPTAAAARASGVGSCASKHALLAERLAGLHVRTRPLFVVGPLVPDIFAADDSLAPGRGLPEVHELLSVSVPGIGPCRVDITWDPPLVAAGLPGTWPWDGRSDMATAVGEATEWWAPDPEHLRDEKEMLRRRLYGDGERATRDAVLAAMSIRLGDLREPPDAPVP